MVCNHDFSHIVKKINASRNELTKECDELNSLYSQLESYGECENKTCQTVRRINARDILAIMEFRIQLRFYQKYAQTAIEIQNACNSSGVVTALDKANNCIQLVGTHLGKGTDWRNTHPIILMLVAKLADLGRMDYTYPRNAEELCQKIADGDFSCIP